MDLSVDSRKQSTKGSNRLPVIENTENPYAADDKPLPSLTKHEINLKQRSINHKNKYSKLMSP